MRGTPGAWVCAAPFVGIIPALAGNTGRYVWWRFEAGDHPRACGEHVRKAKDAIGSWGSSPRLRGTRDRSTGRHSHGGIIPALAGNTDYTLLFIAAFWDHPRACGEHWWLCFHALIILGSSPRLRGTPDRHTPTPLYEGIIPALAGNTRKDKYAYADLRDHPRACGEHAERLSVKKSLPGSSPRLRGTLLDVTKLEWNCGIIPALAGNTISLLYHTYLRMDHPRACGEHNRPIPPWYGAQGSSPRLRGTRRPGEVVSLLLGIIPALAGNTR